MKRFQLIKKLFLFLGMPRSGTTLVEQIISSHSKVYGSGELPYLSQIISEDFLDNTEFSYKKFSKMLENHSANNLVYDKFFSFIKRLSIHLSRL